MPLPESVTAQSDVLEQVTIAIVDLYREQFGTGPSAAKAYAHDDVLVLVLRDGLTTIERTLFDDGQFRTVREMRSAFHDASGDRFTEIVEELTGRKVRAFMSQAHIDPDLVVEVFLLDRPLPSL
ncbi:MAG TPA: Na-translocating system protein MpsC family protein [Acidimicrobiia bacterium]|nr:Na-translocating system protein MpsC family protein [Acidimicrobiia bacterium]